MVKISEPAYCLNRCHSSLCVEAVALCILMFLGRGLQNSWIRTLPSLSLALSVLMLNMSQRETNAPGKPCAKPYTNVS
ncbi:MAG: hypothetical protein ACL7BU_15445 [Candidatus Phlomobacter fragariae]